MMVYTIVITAIHRCNIGCKIGSSQVCNIEHKFNIANLKATNVAEPKLRCCGVDNFTNTLYIIQKPN